jgi:hypothetical protein
MSDQYDEDDQFGYEEPQPQEPPQRSNSEWAALRKEKRARTKAEQELNETRRALVFMQAGIDPADERSGYFVRGYNGELTPAAVRDAALRAGFAEANTRPPEQQQALAAQQRASTVASSGTPQDVGLAAQTQALNEAYAQGGSSALLAKMVELGLPIQAT